MNCRSTEQLSIDPLSDVVVVDDTPVGIQAGLHAGSRTVAVSKTGNSLGLSLKEVDKLKPDDLKQRLTEIELDFRAQGAHYVLQSIAELPILLTSIRR